MVKALLDLTQKLQQDRKLSLRLEGLADKLNIELNSSSVDYLITSNTSDGHLISSLYIIYSPSSSAVIEIEPEYNVGKYKIQLTVGKDEASRVASKVIASVPINNLDRKSIGAVSSRLQETTTEDLLLFSLEILEEELDQITSSYVKKYLGN